MFFGEIIFNGTLWCMWVWFIYCVCDSCWCCSLCWMCLVFFCFVVLTFCHWWRSFIAWLMVFGELKYVAIDIDCLCVQFFVCLIAAVTHGVMCWIHFSIQVLLYVRIWLMDTASANLSDGSMYCFWQCNVFTCVIRLLQCQSLSFCAPCTVSFLCFHIFSMYFHIAWIRQLLHCLLSILWWLSWA